MGISGTTRRAIRSNAVGIGLACGAYAISFGAISIASGLSVAQAQILSAAMFTGASQFALVGVLGAGGGVVAAVLTSTLLGARNGLYALHLATVLRPAGWRRLTAAHMTIDESTGMALAHEYPGAPPRESAASPDGAQAASHPAPTAAAGHDASPMELTSPPGTAGQEASSLAFWSTGISVFLFWNVGTLAGALGASQLSDPAALGLDAAIPAGFLALLWPRLRDRTTWAIAVASGVLALALIPATRPGVPVLASALVAVVWAVRIGERR